MNLSAHIKDLRKYRNLVFIIFVFCMMATFSFLAMRGMMRSSAKANAADFKAGNIISDAVMGNYTSMSKDDIQRFLTSKNQCTNTNYQQYLNLKAAYPNTDWHFENGHFVCLSEERFGNGTEVGQGQTAAEIIYEAAQDFHINPQVILVLLEKEQSLVTDSYPNSNQYRSATGYGCPDTAACDSKYYGFRNQVRNAAELFRYILDNGSRYYPNNVSGVKIRFSPTESCGSSEVFIENRATAALYQYTPYQPNAAALNAGYGTGDSCSAYGNRNFYLYFVDWFGSTQAAVDGQTIIIPDGEYSFVSKTSSSRVLGANGTNVELAELNDNSAAQKWQVTYNSSTGYYTLTNPATKKNLDLYGAVADAGANIGLWDGNASCAQQWKIYRTTDNYLTFESACASAMVLDVNNNNSNVGTNIQVWFTNNGNSQKWTLRTGSTLADGLYVISSSINSKKAIDLHANWSDNGTNIAIWDNHGEDSQRWYVQYNKTTDDYTLTNPHNGKNLDLNGANAKAGANIQLWSNSGSCAQRWKINKTTSGGYQLLSTCRAGYSIDLYNGNIANGTNIQLWDSHNGDSQIWNFTKVTPVIADGVYNVSSKTLQTLVFDAAEGSNQNGTNVEAYSAHGGANQQWQFTYNARTDDYFITSPYSGKSLDVDNGTMQDGRNVHLWDQNQACNQRWILTKDSAGYFNIYSACSQSKSLDMNGASSGSNITIWGAHDGDNQKWRLTKVK